MQLISDALDHQTLLVHGRVNNCRGRLVPCGHQLARRVGPQRVCDSLRDELVALVGRQAGNCSLGSSDVREWLWRRSGWLWWRRRGNRKWKLRRRLSRITRAGARVHSSQPYGSADITTLVFTWNHSFFNVSNCFAKGSCFGSAILGHTGARADLFVICPAMVARRSGGFFPRHFCEFLCGKKAGFATRSVMKRARYLYLRSSEIP